MTHNLTNFMNPSEGNKIKPEDTGMVALAKLNAQLMGIELPEWAAQALHPDLFPDLNVRSETRDFYAAYLGYTTTELDLDTILMTDQ